MFIVVKKSRIIAAVLLVAVLVTGVVLAVEGTKLSQAVAKEKLLPIYGVDTDSGKVGLSFDAAWGSDKTLEILDTLDTYEVKATFFLVGFWVDKYPELVKEIHDRGHLVANHSTNHPHFNTLSESEMALEVDTTAKKITDITGAEVKYFRAPYGEYNNTLLKMLGVREIKCIQWTEDSLDWKGLSGKEIAERILKSVKSGSIILCHNNSDHILDALPLVLLGLKNKGLTSVRMDELVIGSDYYIDNNGIQHSNT